MNREVSDVFLSYNGKDRELATRLAEQLKRLELRVWFDVWNLPPGRSWQDSLQVALHESRSVAVLIGPAGIGPWQKREVETALSTYISEGHPVIPVLLPGTDKPELPDFLAQHRWVDCRDKRISQESLDELIWGITGRRTTRSVSQIGEAFRLNLKEPAPRTKTITVHSLPNPDPDKLLDLTWETFGAGIDILKTQIRSWGSRLPVDAGFGINDAGLVMATFINSAVLGRVKLGYLKCHGRREGVDILEDSLFPSLDDEPTIALFDFEVKRANVLEIIQDELRKRYKEPRFYFAVFGAMTDTPDLKITSYEELVSARNLASLDLKDIFIACTMHDPGIEPPLELR